MRVYNRLSHFTSFQCLVIEKLFMSATNEGVRQDYHLNARTELLPKVPASARTVLEIGCACGEFGKAVMKQQEAEVWGVEPHQEAAIKAADCLHKVFSKPVEEVLGELPNDYFDLIVFNDVLEHLYEPEEVLRSLLPKLSKEGRVLCSVPNLRFYKVVRALLLKGDFQYVDKGVLDRTHIRFFTFKSFQRMLESLGLEIEVIEGNNPNWNFLLRLLNLFTFGFFWDMHYLQIVCVVRKASDSEAK